MTFPYEYPALALVACLLAVLAVRLELRLLRICGLRSPSAGARFAITWISLSFAALTPFHIQRMFVLVVLLPSGIAQLLLYGLAFGTRWGNERILYPRVRARLGRLAESGPTIAPTSRFPRSWHSWIKTLRSFGFTQIAAGEQAEGIIRAVLVRPVDGVIVSIVDQPVRVDRLPLPAVTMFSIADGRRGVLATSFGRGPEACPLLVAQVVPLATPRSLLMRHDEGRGLLEARGIRFEIVSLSEAMDAMGWLWMEIVSSLILLPGDAFYELRKSFRSSTMLASMLEDPIVAQRVAAMSSDSSSLGGSFGTD